MERFQKCVKRFLFRRLLKYSILNYQWNIYEKQYLKIKGAAKQFVPLSQEAKELEIQIRKLYLREY